MKVSLLKHLSIRIILFILWVIIGTLLLTYSNRENEICFVSVLVNAFFSALVGTLLLMIDTFLLHRKHLIAKRNSNLILIILLFVFYIFVVLKYVIGVNLL